MARKNQISWFERSMRTRHLRCSSCNGRVRLTKLENKFWCEGCWTFVKQPVDLRKIKVEL